MADVAPGDVVRFTVAMTQDSQQVLNVYHYKNNGATAVSNDDCHGAIGNVIQSAYDEMEAGLHQSLVQDYLQSYNITQDLPMKTTAWPGSFGGDIAGDALPLQTAGLLTFPTAAKRSLGKKFIAGIAELMHLDAGVMHATLVTALTTAAAELIAPIVAGTSTMIPGNFNKTAASFAPWVSAVVDTLLSTQRRRKPGVGA